MKQAVTIQPPSGTTAIANREFFVIAWICMVPQFDTNGTVPTIHINTGGIREEATIGFRKVTATGIINRAKTPSTITDKNFIIISSSGGGGGLFGLCSEVPLTVRRMEETASNGKSNDAREFHTV
jgi:hypothetical protein